MEEESKTKFSINVEFNFSFKKKLKKIKKVLAMQGIIVYTNNCCDMIAMKREVAALNSRFSVERMSS